MDQQKFKKEEERQLLNHFIAASNSFPKGRILPSESPDFIIRKSRKKSVGIEITKAFSFVNGGQLENNFSSTEEGLFVQKTKELFFKDHTSMISAQFVFSKLNPLTSKNIPAISRQASYIISNKLSGWHMGNYTQWKINKDELPDEIDTIYLTHHKEDQFAIWSSCNGNISQHDFIENITYRIEKKEVKYRLYQKQVADEYWLIIMTQGLVCSSNFNLHNLIEKWPFNSSFDRVFIFDFFSSKIYDLK